MDLILKTRKKCLCLEEISKKIVPFIPYHKNGLINYKNIKKNPY
jgi:hypothetical protein